MFSLADGNARLVYRLNKFDVDPVDGIKFIPRKAAVKHGR